ncbi:hypothetical protein ASZ78_007517 [Callipepla squamata]|uniref:trans-L-3-hydroxyproline dehydratase n=1 Tax=Callipepla squamata TaxID=9009 RepID=A0A226MPQ6_CALSU|nr:hypothetical protein ASZ78_007517 [Callipepla squamata]
MAAAGGGGDLGCRRLPPRSLTEPTLHTVEMHTGGEPLRVIPRLEAMEEAAVAGLSLLELRRSMAATQDHVRRALMHEPRGHGGMYGAVVVRGGAAADGADLAVLFLHGSGYSAMCGHAVLALGRFALDFGLVAAPQCPETAVRLRCPCGPVTAFVPWDGRRSGNPVRFHSVPAFVAATGGARGGDVTVDVPGHGKVVVDISYGGTFYAFLSAAQLGLDVCSSETRDLVSAASAVTEAVKEQASCIAHCISVLQEAKFGDHNAVVVEVSGEAFYTGTATFTLEEEDPLKYGFFFK